MANRRRFLQQLGGTAALFSANDLAAFEAGTKTVMIQPKPLYSPNDTIRLAGIGMGIQGYNDVQAALKVPGVEFVAAADLYTGRLEHAKEVFGSHLFTTKHYQEILDRKDVDAVIIATTDSWHNKICIDALKKGKAVYCEKPMVHKIEQGLEVVNAQKAAGKVLQVGSQRVSSLGFAKAKELYEAGEIGMINSVEAVNTRQSALGAWNYTIPLDSSTQTVDWDQYQSNQQKKMPYDEKRFFRWRNYREFGTGMAGDLYVHLLSGLHYLTGSLGPTKIFSIGDLTYWKDGRNVPDVMNAVLEYPQTEKHPAFQVSLQVNFVSGEGETGYTKITGSDGVMFVSEGKVTVKRRKMAKAPGIGGWDSLATFTNAMQEKLKAEHEKKYSAEDQKPHAMPDITYVAPGDYDGHVAHFANFFESIRTGKPVVEDAAFGFRAAAPCLACNDSYFQNKVIHWDPEKMKLA
jgi:predicted dehydrogenase